jgi:hypothetical protein
MNTMTYIFDTLDFANRLKAAGLDPKVAEVHSELQAELQTKMLDELEKNQEISEQTLSTKADVNILRADLNATKAELKSDLNALELRLDAKFESLRSDMLVKLGGGITILGVLVTVLHYAH